MKCECGAEVGRNAVDEVKVCDLCFQRHCIALQLLQYEEEDDGNA